MLRIEETTAKAIADSIRTYTGETGTIIGANVPTKIAVVYEAGKQAEHEAFWDAYQQNGERRNYNSAFRGNTWNDEMYTPKYEIIASEVDTGTSHIFTSSLITDTKVPITIIGNSTYVFYKSTIKIVPLVRLVNQGQSIGQFGNGSFQLAQALEDITIEGEIITDVDVHWSTKLLKKSILSFMNALSVNVTGKTITFSKAAVNNAFETVQGAADGSSSTEWLALVASKPYWTISLI